MSEHHLILGGNGFIGRHVAILLARRGHRVTIAMRPDRDVVLPADVDGAIGRLCHDRAAGDWDRLVETADVVHDYAWSSVPASANADPAKDLFDNLGAVTGLLEALRRRGGGRVVFASSGGTVYGRTTIVPTPEETALHPITAYGAGKTTAELYFNLYADLHGLDCRVARIANVYGHGQDLTRGVGAVTAFLGRALDGRPIEIWGDGTIVRDFVHVVDLARCLVALAQMPKGPETRTFNVGGGVGSSLNDIVAILRTVLARPIEVAYRDGRSFDVPKSVLSIDKARRLIGWAPRIDLQDGIRRMLGPNALPTVCDFTAEDLAVVPLP